MLILFCLHTMGLGMFRFVASLCRDETIASTAGSFFFLVLLLLGGFLLPRRALVYLTSSDTHMDIALDAILGRA